MKEKLLKQIEQMISVIYSVDKAKLDENFTELIDCLIKAIDEEYIPVNENFNDILIKIQMAYEKKDLVELADLLLYQLKEFCEENLNE